MLCDAVSGRRLSCRRRVLDNGASTRRERINRSLLAVIRRTGTDETKKGGSPSVVGPVMGARVS